MELKFPVPEDHLIRAIDGHIASVVLLSGEEGLPVGHGRHEPFAVVRDFVLLERRVRVQCDHGPVLECHDDQEVLMVVDVRMGVHFGHERELVEQGGGGGDEMGMEVSQLGHQEMFVVLVKKELICRQFYCCILPNYLCTRILKGLTFYF